MSAILHCIVTGIENDRISRNINEWKNKFIEEKKLNCVNMIIEGLQGELNELNFYATEDEGSDIDLNGNELFYSIQIINDYDDEEREEYILYYDEAIDKIEEIFMNFYKTGLYKNILIDPVCKHENGGWKFVDYDIDSIELGKIDGSLEELKDICFSHYYCFENYKF
tara:strand:+ start:106 stop:606 length:501 start_codon:yes stop_codon:yes gene_type:complete